MTFKNLQDEVILNRFQEGTRPSVKSWINVRYTAIWNAADWYFKHVTASPWAITAGDDAPAMFSDFAEAEGVFDQDGAALFYLPQKEFEDTYLGDSSIGTPEAYTVVNREIILGPTPGAARTFYLSYRRRLSHVDGPSGLAAAGVMVNDSDQPLRS